MQRRGRSALGRRGEDLACDFLCSRGHHILERNWRGGHLEIDIISEADDGVHFVEVKSRTAPAEAAPEEKVGALKQRRISEAALKYLNARTGGEGQEVFFDIVSVLFDGNGAEVKYFPQAWIPLYT